MNMKSLGLWKEVDAGFKSLGKKLNKNFIKEISPVYKSLSELKETVSKLKESYRENYNQLRKESSKELNEYKEYIQNYYLIQVGYLADYNSIKWANENSIEKNELPEKVDDKQPFYCAFDTEKLKQKLTPIVYQCLAAKTMEGFLDELDKIRNFDLSPYKRTKEDRESIIYKRVFGINKDDDSQMEKLRNFLKSHRDYNWSFFRFMDKNIEVAIRNAASSFQWINRTELRGKEEKIIKYFNSLMVEKRTLYFRHKETCEKYLKKNKINILSQAKAEYKFIDKTLLPYINGRIEKLSDKNIQAFLKNPPAKKEKGE